MKAPKVFQFGTDLWDPSHRYQTSWLLPPWALFAVRASIAIYTLTVLLFNIGYTCDTTYLGGCKESGDSFSYFTVLTYWGISFYMFISAVHTATFAWSGGTSSLLDKFPRPLQAFHALYYTTVTTFPFLVTAVFWAILYPEAWGSIGGFPNSYYLWSNVSQHALNSVFALFEIFFTRANPHPWIHLLWLCIILALYCAVAYITAGTKQFYTYSFLNPNVMGSGLVAGYCFGIAAAIIVFFTLSRYAIWLRKWLAEKKMGLEGKFPGGMSGSSVGSDSRPGSWQRSGASPAADIEMAAVEPTRKN